MVDDVHPLMLADLSTGTLGTLTSSSATVTTNALYEAPFGAHAPDPVFHRRGSMSLAWTPASR